MELGIQTFSYLYQTPNLLSYCVGDWNELKPHQMANLKDLEFFWGRSDSNPTSLFHLSTLLAALPSQSLTTLTLYLHNLVIAIAISRLIKILSLKSMKSLKKLNLNYYADLPVTEMFDEICRRRRIEGSMYTLDLGTQMMIWNRTKW